MNAAPPHPDLKIIAIDDEPLALGRLECLLDGMHGAKLIATSERADDTLALVARLRPDILLLDIEMPGQTGLELATKILQMAGPRPVVIFVTAFDHYALDAFQAHAVDYVLKPMSRARLEQALARAGALVRQQRACEQHQRDNAIIWAQRGSDFVQLRSGDIERAESERDYVHVHNAERAYLLRTTLSTLHAQLGHDRYIRIRRSMIVRRDRISCVQDRGYGDIRVHLHSGAVMRVGRTYLKPVRDQLRRTEAPVRAQIPFYTVMY